jgi:exosortase
VHAIPWLQVAWFFALLVLCYAPVLGHLVEQWNNDEDVGHGFFVPPIAAYIAWTRREQLFRAENIRPNYWGLAIVVFAALQLFIATLGAEIFLARIAFIVSVVGSILFVGGLNALRILAFPILLLLFMVPLPKMLYAQITLPLQTLASWFAEHVLNLLGTPVFREGNILHLPNQDLSVVEACSGIRSLLSLSFLALVYAYFFDNRVWMRWVLLILTVPIAIVANAGRVTMTGLLGEINPEWSRGFFHSAEGWVIFMIALGILILTHQAITRMVRRYGHGSV